MYALPLAGRRRPITSTWRGGTSSTPRFATSWRRPLKRGRGRAMGARRRGDRGRHRLQHRQRRRLQDRHARQQQPDGRSPDRRGPGGLLRKTLAENVLPAWVKRCGARCGDIYNEVVAPITGVRYASSPVTADPIRVSRILDRLAALLARARPPDESRGRVAVRALRGLRHLRRYRAQLARRLDQVDHRADRLHARLRHRLGPGRTRSSSAAHVRIDIFINRLPLAAAPVSALLALALLALAAAFSPMAPVMLASNRAISAPPT